MAIKYPETFGFLTEYGKRVVALQKIALNNAGKFKGSKGGGPLENSLMSVPYINQSEYGVKFKMNDYGQFVDEGVEGYQNNRTGKYGKGGSRFKFKPKNGKGTGKSKLIPLLKAWAIRKGVDVGLVYPIRRNLWKWGIPRSNFYTSPITKTETQFIKGLESALAKDFENNIQKNI